jgi:creatinine amidohydrolase
MLDMHPGTVDLGALPPLPTPIRTSEVGVLDHPTCAGQPAPDFSICPDQDPRRATAEHGREDVVREGKSIAGKVGATLATVMGSSGRPRAWATSPQEGSASRCLTETPQANHSMEGIRYELLRPQQIIAARTKAPVAYIPIGPLEWHGPHLPYGTDMLHAYAMALEAARETGGVVLPPLPIGTETYTEPERLRYQGFKGDERVVGIDFPGFPLTSLYIEESAFGIIVREMVRALKRQAFRVIGLVNGHGAPNQRTTLERLAMEESEPGRAAVFLTGFRFVTRYRGHAELGETSFTLAYHPESVDLGALPPLPTPLGNLDFAVLDGPTCAGQPTRDFTVRGEQDPRQAEAARGKDDVAYEAHHIALKVRELLPAVQG